jgi:hypothetical protein
VIPHPTPLGNLVHQWQKAIPEVARIGHHQLEVLEV